MEVSIDEPLNVDWDGNELLLSDILGTDDDVISRRLEDEVEIALGKSHQITDEAGADDHPSAFGIGNRGRNGENTEGGGRSPGNFTVLYFTPGKTHHEAAAERNREI